MTRLAFALGLTIASASTAAADPPCNCEEPASWVRDEPGPFGAGQLDAGIAFLRPRFSFGWGHANEEWFGLDLNPVLSPSAVGGYGGLRLAVPFVEARVGARYNLSLRRSYYAPQHAFTREELQQRLSNRARYGVIEAEVEVEVPTGAAGFLRTELGYSYVTGVPDDTYLLEDRLHVVIAPPHAFRLRAAWLARVGRYDNVKIGPAFEVVGNPGRELFVVQAGLMARIRLWPFLELRLNFLPPIESRDQLGIAGGDFGLGLRYRWARPFSAPPPAEVPEDFVRPATAVPRAR